MKSLGLLVLRLPLVSLQVLLLVAVGVTAVDVYRAGIAGFLAV